MNNIDHTTTPPQQKKTDGWGGRERKVKKEEWGMHTSQGVKKSGILETWQNQDRVPSVLVVSFRNTV